jgi:hypothetical protein
MSTRVGTGDGLLCILVCTYVSLSLFENNHVFLRTIEQVSSSNGVEIFTWFDCYSLSLSSATRQFFDAEADDTSTCDLMCQ